MSKNKAFTLIELLVVIAIIGILVGITISSVSGAKMRAFDAQIKSILLDERIRAESYFVDQQSYIGFIPSRTLPFCSKEISGTCSANIDFYTDRPQVRIASDGQKIAIWADLCGPENRCWCIDSSGFSNVIISAPPSFEEKLGECR